MAVKIVTGPVGSNGPHHAEVELKVLARLNHHSLVTLLDAGVDRTEPERPRIYLVMELVEGPDLKRRLADGPLPPRHAAQIGHDLAEALAYIHDSGVIHRDVKPGNIMIFDYHHDAARMRAKLTDFGIALIADKPESPDGGFLGTAGYLSPEQARSESVGPASDVYSLGLVLLECLTGQQAFPGRSAAERPGTADRGPEHPGQPGAGMADAAGRHDGAEAGGPALKPRGGPGPAGPGRQHAANTKWTPPPPSSPRTATATNKSKRAPQRKRPTVPPDPPLRQPLSPSLHTPN